MLDGAIWASPLAFFLAAASPGPATLAVATTAMACGALLRLATYAAYAVAFARPLVRAGYRRARRPVEAAAAAAFGYAGLRLVTARSEVR